MWNCKVAVPFGTPVNANTGELRPHHRKLIENADAFAVLKTNMAVAQTINRIRIVSPSRVPDDQS